MTLPIPVQQLQTDIQNELTTANQLLRLISIEVQKIKDITMPGGELETIVKQNISITEDLAKLQNVNIAELLPLNNLQPQSNEGQDPH